MCRSAFRRLVPRGHPSAIRAALTLLHSAGGEGEEEEAEDLRAVAAGALALALLGPGVGESETKTIDAIVARMGSPDTPVSHLPHLASALHSFAQAPNSMQEEVALGKLLATSLAIQAVLPPRRPPPAGGGEGGMTRSAGGQGGEEGGGGEVDALAQEEEESTRWARATMLRVQRGLAEIVGDVEAAHAVLAQSEGKKNGVRARMRDDTLGPDAKAALNRELEDLEAAARESKAKLLHLTDPVRGDELVRQLVQVLSSASWIYLARRPPVGVHVGAAWAPENAISVLKRKTDLEELAALVGQVRWWMGSDAFARHVYGRRALMGLLSRHVSSSSYDMHVSSFSYDMEAVRGASSAGSLCLPRRRGRRMSL